MPTSPEERPGVLFVDDDQAFLETVGQLFSSWSHGNWQVYLASTSAKALALLQAHRIKLAVIDIQMPVVDGQQFLILLQRKYPGLHSVVLTGYANEEYRTACLNGGAELFLEKPRTPEGFESVFATLNELAVWKPQEGFRGLLRQVGLQDVLQMECLGRNSSLLEVSTAKAHGLIYIRNGSIIHAETDDQSGEKALNLLLALRGGEFNLKPFAEPPRQTIEGQWEFLLMEAARMRDEAAEHPPTEGESPRKTHEWSKTPGGGEPSRGILRPDAPALAPARRSRPVSWPAQRRIEEVVICSDQGEVLYAWQCIGIDMRLKLFQLIAEKAEQLNRALPMGPFARLEITGPSGRCVTQVEAARKLFVRSGPMSASRDI